MLQYIQETDGKEATVSFFNDDFVPGFLGRRRLRFVSLHEEVDLGFWGMHHTSKAARIRDELDVPVSIWNTREKRTENPSCQSVGFARAC
jgi:hypothetical protein